VHLADFLRKDLVLTGTHLGCEHGVCGACTVLVNGATARACLMLAVQADGCSVETIESVAAADGTLPDAVRPSRLASFFSFISSARTRLVATSAISLGDRLSVIACTSLIPAVCIFWRIEGTFVQAIRVPG
jgi:hypothetical protein